MSEPHWFSTLDKAATGALEAASSSVSLPARSTLFDQGLDPRCLYLICNGYIKLSAGTRRSRHMIMRIAGPGSVLGLTAVFSSCAYEVSAETLTEVRVSVLGLNDFLDFLRNHTDAQRQAVQLLCEEYCLALQSASRNALVEGAAARLGLLLLQLGQEIGDHVVDGGYRVPFLLTHHEMASMICCTRETVTRILSQFRKDGLISMDESFITLHQSERLQILNLGLPDHQRFPVSRDRD